MTEADWYREALEDILAYEQVERGRNFDAEWLKIIARLGLKYGALWRDRVESWDRQADANVPRI